MMDKEERTALVKALVSTTREYITKSLDVIWKRIENIDERVKAIPSGPTGQRGEKGDKGDSIMGLSGNDGAPGKDGSDGINGAAGIDGKDGTPGIDGKPGERGIDGRDGKDGIAGRDGREGKDGINGRDALDLQILPAIDPAKSYPRGTWARYRGGVIRAIRNSEPMGQNIEQSGWEVIWDGVASIQAVQSLTLRTFAIKLWLTSGEQPETTFTIPVMIHRGVFREGQDYERGDVATYGGSEWHCQVEKTTQKPGTGTDWLLVVKHGRDGKDGKNGDTGPQGPTGAAGRDHTQRDASGKTW